ncbi:MULTISPECIES: cupin domain-containing protein [unclassified Pseudoalteromonas]|uniref:cupin domain-containing protein n=1 Tax=unclassified Pseudoalteromonas TaxID=194690 RepID=UPI000B3C6C3D|nr:MULTISPECIES: cupin domain-containing protein [unclassified Pseudoalteromonas]MDN3377852.1 cupin domain-containing protein [Pseudoalteromonas sp. APC 3893]MDN3386048.1 cupin domain-containing protein [Pseudoalteromonas sp. APC 4017]OUS69233.1 cupin [Pseudoalteromonas sp. A601]
MTTLINANFEQRVVIQPTDYEWVGSTAPGVERIRLDRIGDEVARATSIVRFAPNSTFPSHNHDGGEEFLVLEGVFSDEYQDYPKGSYVRNPIGTSHSPNIGKEGATILVKLHQFDQYDTEKKIIYTQNTPWQQGLIDGLRVMSLHEFQGEHIALVKWAPNTQFKSHTHWGGEEIFVLEGTFYDEHGRYPKGTWLRSPHMSQHTPFTKEDGALIYVKVGHL